MVSESRALRRWEGEGVGWWAGGLVGWWAGGLVGWWAGGLGVLGGAGVFHLGNREPCERQSGWDKISEAARRGWALVSPDHLFHSTVRMQDAGSGQRFLGGQPT